MNRRSVALSLAALGGVVAGGALMRCTPTNTDEPRTTWGVLSLYPTSVTTIAGAGDKPPVGDDIIRIPFFNHRQLNFKKGQVVGFQLIAIGCGRQAKPFQFAVADIVTTTDHEDSDPDAVSRNEQMDRNLRELGYGGNSSTQECPGKK
jgi:hypothetical protein